MSDFTPGPWETDEELGHESVLGADGAMVADCAIFGLWVIRSQRVNQANARLIAAAPEMLAALRQMVVNSKGDRKEYRDCHKKALAAIAKAIGEKE